LPLRPCRSFISGLQREILKRERKQEGKPFLIGNYRNPREFRE